MNNKKILVIDFDAEFLQTVTQFLRAEGFQVVNAMDGIAGLEKFKSETPDLVVMEAMLPRLHGFELCSKIAKDEQHAPVIIMTGVYKDPVYKTEALRTFGATAYFEKPFSLDSLKTTIRRILNIAEAPVKKEEKKEAAPAHPVHEVKVAKAPDRAPSPDRLHVEKKKESVRHDDADVDRLLKTALADFGFSQTKKRPAQKPPDLAAKEKTAPMAAPRPVEVERPAEPAHQPSKEASAMAQNLKAALAKELALDETPIREQVIKAPIIEEPIIKEPLVKEAIHQEPFLKESVLKESEYNPAKVHEPSFADAPVAESSAEFPEDARFHKPEPQKKPGKTAWDPFLEFYPEKKKGISPRLIAIAAGVLVVSSLAFYFLRPHKNRDASNNTPTNQTAESAVQNQEEPAPLSSQQLLNTIEKMGQGQDTQKNNEIQNKVNIPPPDTPPAEAARAEDIKPLAPTENSKLQIQLPDVKPGIETKAEAQDQRAAGQRQAANPEEKLNPAAGGAGSAKPNQGDLLALDQVDSQPIIIRSADAIYPPLAQSLKVEGQVSVSALISEFGDVLQVRIIRGIQGNLGFERATENAVKQWKFKPAQKDGVNVKVWKPFVITFRLKR